MHVTSIGDLARNLQLRRDTSTIRQDLTRLTNELSSGIDSNLADRFKGNFNPLTGVERGLLKAESYLVVISERELVIRDQQSTLNTFRTLGDISSTLMLVQESGDPTLVTTAGHDALSRFDSALANLNTQSGGRTNFSGIATDRPAVADADTILSAIEVEITTAGATTANDVAQVVSDWFQMGGGYDTVGYIGGPQPSSGPRLSDGEIAASTVTADDRSIREFLSGLAMSSLLARDVLPGDTTERGNLARLSGLNLIEAGDGIVDLQAQIGASEGQLSRARVEVMAETESLKVARSNLISVDPYETAVELQSVETQLQTLYAITARLSGLSLTRYL
jgi:flagellar hook-associated protein 3 FlgL